MASIINWLCQFLLSWFLDKISEPLKEWLEGKFSRGKHIREIDTIKQSFERYSRQYLKQNQYSINRIGHIERNEVGKIINAWGNGVNGIILTGTAGSGKSGLVLDLAKTLHRRGTPVLFIRATDYYSIADPASAIKQRLSNNKDLGEALSIIGSEHECVVIVDQLDSVSESISLAGFVSLLKSIQDFPGIRVLAVSRVYEAENSKLIKDLGFSRIESRELDVETAQSYLRAIGVSNYTDDLLGLSRNLLNLSLIAELVASGNNLSAVVGLAQLWEKYLLSIRERDGEEAFELGMELADQLQISGEKEISLNWSQLSSTTKLHSSGIITPLLGTLRFRFRHEQLQTFLCAYSLYRKLLDPQKVVERYGKYNSKSILIWLCAIYGLKDPKAESEFAEQILKDNGVIPFYSQTAILDQYAQLDKLVGKSDVVRVILETIKARNNLQNHFYRSNPKSVWASQIWDYGFLLHPPQSEKENGILPFWLAQYYLISVAHQVPEIVLQHVNELDGHGWYLARAIEALCKIPIIYSEKAVPKVLKWLSNPEVAEIAQKEVLEFMSILVKNGKAKAALGLFDVLCLQRDENKSYNTKYSYRELFGIDPDKSNTLNLLQSCCPAEIIQIFEKRLVDSLYDEAGNKKISWWRNAIEDTDQDLLDNYQDYVLKALRDTLVILMSKKPAQGIEFVARYLSDGRDILRRLGLFLIRQFPNHFRTNIINELLEESNLDDVDIHHEYFSLLRSGYNLLDDYEKKVLLKMVLSGPDIKEVEENYERYWKSSHPDREIFIENWRNAWVRDRLSMIRDFLDGETKSILDDLEAKGGKSEHPDFLSWSSGAFWVKDVSPYSELELSKFSPDQLLDFVRTWRPNPKEDFGPERISYEGFAKEIARLICSSPEFYNKVLLDICLARPENASAIINLWAGSEFDKDIPWTIVIDLVQGLLKDKQVWNNDSQETYGFKMWRNVRLNIVQLLGNSFVNKNKQIPSNLLENVQFLLIQLVDDPDPTLEADRPQDGWFGHNDPITVSLNHVRPVALAALIRCTIRLAKQTEESDERVTKEDRKMPDLVAKKLTQKLDPQTEPSWAVRSVFGDFVPKLYWLDKKWLLSHLDSIFPIAQGDENTWLFISAWDAYILNQYYQDIFIIMRPKYRQAIQYLSQGYKTESHLNQSDYLSAHLIHEYFFSDLGLMDFIASGGLLHEFFQKAQPELRSRLPWVLWKICEGSPEKYWGKARAIWEWRSKESINYNHSSDFNSELLGLALLLRVAPNFETVKSMQSLLDGLLPHLRNVDSHDLGWHSVEIFLERQVEQEPVDVINFYRLMCEQIYKSPQWVYHSDSVRKIIELATKNPKSRVYALALIDFFAQNWRDYTFESIYKEYTG